MTGSGSVTTGARRMPVVMHGIRAMSGRDPHETHRPATSLELLFDLTFVIAFGVAGSEFAHLLAAGEYRSGLIGFGFAMFAVIWAWINFTWFASAYDTDDWLYRVFTMVQMTGVVVLALGLPALFDSLHHHEAIDLRAVMVGYVIMRVPMVAQWLRAARQDPLRAAVCRRYAVSIVVAQLGWVASVFFELKAGPALLWFAPLIAFEMAVPFLAERRQGTPWHPHHIAERYGLLAIIALGEVLIGTVAAVGAVLDVEGWTFDIALFATAGVGLTFGLWWIYFLLPAGEILHLRRDRSFGFGYGHFPLYASIAAVGAGLHVAALYLEDHAEISATAVMWTITIPLIVYFVAGSWLFVNLLGVKASNVTSTAVKIAIALVAVAMAAADVDLAWCVLVAALAPVSGVVLAEITDGHHINEHVQGLSG